jgi:hypothetical protein
MTMRELKPRIAAIGAAAAEVVARAEREQELEEAARLALEKIPVKDAMTKLLAQLDTELNAALQVALERFLGEPVIDPERQVRGRLTHGQYEGDPGLTYFMGETPILWVGQAAITREGDFLRAERQIRQLLEPA